MDISQKQDWSSAYTHETPIPYFKVVSEQEYQVPNYALHYINPLVKKLYAERQRPITIVDIGASYGIMSALLLHDLSLEDLIDFFCDREPISWEKIEQFYANQRIRHQEYQFYVTDSSQPAMAFAERVNLCEKSYCFDMKQERVLEELQPILAKTDLFIATGSLAYIGKYFFEQVFPIISEQENKPLFAFVVYRAFYSQEIEQVFQNYNYSLLKGDYLLRKARKFASEAEKAKTLSYLAAQNVDTSGWEQEGYYAGEFYLGLPNSQRELLEHWLRGIVDSMNSETF